MSSKVVHYGTWYYGTLWYIMRGLIRVERGTGCNKSVGMALRSMGPAGKAGV
jgi:hypothetical protein